MFENNVICFNRVDVKAGSGQIFYSYQPPVYQGGKTLSDYDFAIIVQAKDKNITFKRQNYGHAKGSMEQIAKDTWTNFFRGNNAKNFLIEANKKEMVAYAPIKSNELYTGNLRYFIDGPATISVYGYRKNWTMLTGNEPVYPYNYDSNYKDPNADKDKNQVWDPLRQYSGCGSGYFMMVNPIEIKVSELLANKSVSLVTHSRDNHNYTVNGGVIDNEIIPIRITGKGNYTANIKDHYKKENDPLGNLGNWSAQYYIPIKFINDIEYKNASIQYVLQGNGYFVIQYVDNGEIKVVSNMDKDKDEKDNANKEKTSPWDFTKKYNITFTEGRKEIPFNYQFILGTNSSEYVKHTFRLK